MAVHRKKTSLARDVPALSDQNQVVIGAIDRSFGVKGELLVTSLSDVPGRFHVGARVELAGPQGRHLSTVVTSVRSHGNRFIVGVEMIGTPEEVASYRGGYVYATRSAVSAPPDHFFQYDLLGLTVEDEHGRSIGTIEHIDETAAHHLFVVRQGSQEYLIPAVKEWVLDVDLQRRVMTVIVPELLGASNETSIEARHAV